MTEAIDTPAEQTIAGRGISRGVGFGYAHLDEPASSHLDAAPVPADRVTDEVARLRRALDFVGDHLEEHVREFHAPTDEDLHQILATHQLILDDTHFVGRIIDRIEKQAMRAERAVEEAFFVAADRLAATRDAYLRARAEDLRDVCQIICRVLTHGEEALHPITADGRDLVFVATHLHVSGVLRARRAGAKAFITSSRAFSSHGAILLRAAGIPSVGGVEIPAHLEEGAPLLVDGLAGEVTLYPSDHTRAATQRAEMRPESIRKNRSLPPEPAISADGARIPLWANIDTPIQAELCLDYRLEGIGLFRTEFLILETGRPPNEEEQVRVYREVVEKLRGRPLIIRTFDIGAEKVTTGLADDTAANPALGLRGLRRHLLRRPDELRTQLRAVLRATADAEASVLFPMVTNVGEIRAAREHLEAARRELEDEGQPFNRTLKLAAMIEVPAAALGIVEILEAVDFVTIGTNDLTQYLSAADRNNADVAAYLKPDTSGLFDALRWMIRRARRADRVSDVLVGGEVASDPEVAAQIAAMGYSGLIITPLAAPAVRQAIAATHSKSAA